MNATQTILPLNFTDWTTYAFGIDHFWIPWVSSVDAKILIDLIKLHYMVIVQCRVDEMDYFDDQTPYENDQFDIDDLGIEDDLAKMMHLKNKMYI